MGIKEVWDDFRFLWLETIRDTLFLIAVTVILWLSIAAGWVLVTEALTWISYQ